MTGKYLQYHRISRVLSTWNAFPLFDPTIETDPTFEWSGLEFSTSTSKLSLCPSELAHCLSSPLILILRERGAKMKASRGWWPPMITPLFWMGMAKLTQGFRHIFTCCEAAQLMDGSDKFWGGMVGNFCECACFPLPLSPQVYRVIALLFDLRHPKHRTRTSESEGTHFVQSTAFMSLTRHTETLINTEIINRKVPIVLHFRDRARGGQNPIIMIIITRAA